jgi:hypothetical protein
MIDDEALAETPPPSLRSRPSCCIRRDPPAIGLAQESKRSSFRAKQGIFISSEHVLEIWNLTLSNPNPGFADATTGGPLTTSSYHHFE